MNDNCGIYRIKNTVTGDYYIGSATNIKHRLRQHCQRLTSSTHCNRHLQFAWNKYGEQAFKFAAILLCDIENKLYYEQVLIDGLKPAYNLSVNAVASMQGLHHSEETRIKMSDAAMGNTTCLGHKHTEEARHNMSEAQQCRSPISEEARAKMSEAHKGELNPNFGKHRTEETCAKISKAHKGKPNGRLGTHLSEETKCKLSVANKVAWIKRKSNVSI